MDERPPISPSKLLHQYTDWVEGTEMPGRTMAYLKTGMLHEVLAADDGESAATMLEAWELWEKGTVGPTPTLESLKESGVAELLGALAS